MVHAVASALPGGFWDLGFRVRDLGCRVQDLGCRVQGTGRAVHLQCLPTRVCSFFFLQVLGV